MRNALKSGGTLMLSAILVAGLACDERPTAPPAVIDQAEKAAAQQAKPNKHPTTQDLVSGKRIRTALIPLPLTLEVPPGWGKFEDNNDAGIKIGGSNLIHGYTPNGEVQILLASRSPLKQEDLDLLIKAGKKVMAAKPQEILKFELRPLGTVQVLERQSVGQPANLTTYDKDMKPHTSTESAFKWTISVLVPNQGAFQVFELNFMDLTQSQYEKDKDFLRGIIDTLRYAVDSTASPATAPAASMLP